MCSTQDAISGQVRTFWPVWVAVCSLSLCAVRKPTPQTWHWCGRRPVCSTWCTCGTCGKGYIGLVSQLGILAPKTTANAHVCPAIFTPPSWLDSLQRGRLDHIPTAYHGAYHGSWLRDKTHITHLPIMIRPRYHGLFLKVRTGLPNAGPEDRSDYGGSPPPDSTARDS